MAHRTTNGEAQKRSPIRLSPLPRDVDPYRLGNRAALVAADPRTDVSAGDDLVQVAGRQHIARNLLLGKLVERLVAVARLDQGFAIGPGVPVIVQVQSIAIGIASVIKPITSPLFAVSRAGQQTIHNVLVSLRRLILNRS